MPSNARQHPREEVTLRVDYMDAQGRGGLGLAKNLSYTGIALTSLSRPLQVGDTLVLTFVTSPRNACKLHALTSLSRTRRVWASCSRMPKKPTGNYGGRLPPPLRTSRAMRRSRPAHPRSPRVLGSGDPGLRELSNRTQQRSRAPVAAPACPHTGASACRNVVCAVGESRALHPCESGGLSQRHPARQYGREQGRRTTR